MSAAPDTHDAHDYAEHIRERLPRRWQEIQKCCGLSKYGLARESGVSREYLRQFKRGKANSTQPVTAQISLGLGMTLEGGATARGVTYQQWPMQMLFEKRINALRRRMHHGPLSQTGSCSCSRHQK